MLNSGINFLEICMKLAGSIVALVTPFNNGKICKKSLLSLLDFHLQAKTDAILIAGTTGEAATMDIDEYGLLLKTAVVNIGGKVPVLAGTGLNDTSQTIARGNLAAELGADYALVVTPYYNKPTQRGLLEHFTKVADNSPIPVILYNVPSRTGVNMVPDTVIKLSAHPNIVGVKEASGNAGQAADIINGTPSEFALFSGDDKINLPLMSIGARGAISVVANVIPGYFRDFIHYALDKNSAQAQKAYYRLLELSDVLFIETNPAPAKFMLYKTGKIISHELRLPLTSVGESSEIILTKVMKSLELI
jgi:4-hydroxy-tetrahydrodipicolinate synthase